MWRAQQPKVCMRCENDYMPDRSNQKLCRTCNPKSGGRASSLFKRYGMTLEDFQLIWDKQEGKCAVCGVAMCHAPPDSEKQHRKSNTVSVDHNHETMQVRGLLCIRCNRAIGYAEKYLAAIVAYLQNPGYLFAARNRKARLES